MVGPGVFSCVMAAFFEALPLHLLPPVGSTMIMMMVTRGGKGLEEEVGCLQTTCGLPMASSPFKWLHLDSRSFCLSNKTAARAVIVKM